MWQLQAPEIYVPRKPPFSYPTLNRKVLNGCCLVSMWFYNMCLKSNDLLWYQWELLTTKQLVSSSVTLQDSFDKDKLLQDSFDKDKPVKPVTKLKGAPPRSRRQLQLMAAMALLANATGAGRVFHTRAELQLKHKLRQFRACNGILDTSRIHGTKLTALHSSKVATDKIFDTATNNSKFAFTAVADSGFSETCTNNLQDFIPGTMWKLEVPLALGGIAGSLLVTHAGRVH